MRARLAMLLGVCLSAGCVERTLDVRSDPPGALVYLNDQEIGRTPLSRRFIWYGTYDVQVRMEGYQTVKAATPVIAPWWQWVPIDLVAELLPVKLQDTHAVAYHLTPLSAAQVDPQATAERGQELRERLESSRVPQTQPAGKQSKK